MPRVIEASATLSDRYQTTVPEAVRQALGLGERDQIRFVVRSDRSVVLERARELVAGIEVDLEADPDRALDTDPAGTTGARQHPTPDASPTTRSSPRSSTPSSRRSPISARTIRSRSGRRPRRSASGPA